MKEEMTDLIKYRPVVLELRELLGKKYSVSNSPCRWINIYRKGFWDSTKVAEVYPIDEGGYGNIIVSDPKLYDLFKKYGELKGYPSIERDFKNDEDDATYHVEPIYIKEGVAIKDSRKILKIRYAKGELNSKEYTERMSRL